ncbi:MAG: VWA domain-containing protein [bacterium]|nr:VWA domain-containing protein [bacterium]
MRQIFLAGIAGKSLPPFLAIVAFFLISTGAVPQQQPDLSSFVESIDVRVINLEVVVTDRGGNRVTDLRPEDFRLIVDGEEVAIDYFSEIRQRQAVSPQPAAQERHREDPEAEIPWAPAPAVDAGADVVTHFLLFVDNYFGIQGHRDLVLEELQDDLSMLGPNDRFAIIAFDGRELDLIGPWSSSPETIKENLRRAMEQPAFGLARRGEQSRFDKGYDLMGIKQAKAAFATNRVRSFSRQIKSVVGAATSAMRSYATLPGRKVMLLMAGGWPRDPIVYTVGMDHEVRAASLHYSSTKDLNNLISTANLLGYTLYPIDLPGAQVRGPGAGDRSVWMEDMANIGYGAAAGGSSGGDSREPAPDLSADRVDSVQAERSFAASTLNFNRTVGREHEIEASLMVMAEKTGGLAMLNSFREVALAETLQDVGSYYWLGFTPERHRDDEQHSMRVKILRPGLKARSRRGFSDFSRATEATMMVESQLLFSTNLGTQALGVELGTPERHRRGQLRVPVSLRIPLDGVVMLPVAEGHQAQLELRVAAIDEDGNRSEIPVIPIRLGGATPPPAGAHAVYDTELRLRSDTRRLVLAVHDVVGEGILTSSVDFDAETEAAQR